MIKSLFFRFSIIFVLLLKVLEHLKFHAALRMGRRVSSEKQRERVDEVLQEFNLEICKNVGIGIPGTIKGISGGQRRRLAFATEVNKESNFIELFFKF